MADAANYSRALPLRFDIGQQKERPELWTGGAHAARSMLQSRSLKDVRPTRQRRKSADRQLFVGPDREVALRQQPLDEALQNFVLQR